MEFKITGMLRNIGMAEKVEQSHHICRKVLSQMNWVYREMQKITWTEHVSKEKIVEKMGEKKINISLIISTFDSS